MAGSQTDPGSTRSENTRRRDYRAGTGGMRVTQELGSAAGEVPADGADQTENPVAAINSACKQVTGVVPVAGEDSG